MLRQFLSIILYTITQVILAFWLVLAYDLLEDRRIDNDSARFKFFLIFWVLNLNQSQFFAKLTCASCAIFLFLPHFDIICDLLLNRRTATWILFVKLAGLNSAASHFSYINDDWLWWSRHGAKLFVKSKSVVVFLKILVTKLLPRPFRMVLYCRNKSWFLKLFKNQNAVK